MESMSYSVIHLTKAVSDVEKALHDYHYYPLRGLSKLQSSLLSMQTDTLQDHFHPLFHLRLDALLASVKKLIDSGAPYDEKYHVIFSSALDALFQTAFASQFGVDHSLQLSHLLSAERDCWAKLPSTLDAVNANSVTSVYTAFLPADSSSWSPKSIEDILTSLSGVGDVSFHLNACVESLVGGYFKLSTIQSLAWLRSRFPEWRWHESSDSTDEPMKRLCELSFLPLYQNLTLSRVSRAQLVAQFEQAFKKAHYQTFDTLFSVKASNVLNGHICVPIERDFPGIDFDQGVTYFPVHHGGYVYSGCRPLNEQDQTVLYTACLGRDFLPHFLYEVSTTFGQFVFDQHDVHGRYAVVDSDFERDGNQLWFATEKGIRAQLLLSLPVFDKKGLMYCVLPRHVSNVVVIRQAGLYFALPYDRIRDVEGVCSRMQSPQSWIKNVWQTPSNACLLEPLLFHFDNVSTTSLGRHNKQVGKKPKSGYYSGRMGESLVWLCAELVSVILPYQRPDQFVWMNERQFVSTAFIIHDGECFDKVLTQHTCYDSVFVLDEPAEFFVVLECEEDVAVLPFSHCEWHASLPDEWNFLSSTERTEIQSEHSEPFDSVVFRNKIDVVNTENFALFVAEFRPYFHEFKSDH